MIKDKRSLKKLQIRTAWILFLCVMFWLLLAGIWGQWEKARFGVTCLFAVSCIVAGLDILAALILQISLTLRVKGIQAALRIFIKDFLISLATAALIVFVLSFGKKMELGTALFDSMLPYSIFVFIGSYLGKFWSIKLPKE